MKDPLLIFFLFLLSIPLMAQDSEKQTIIKMIETQHKAFADRDYEAWASHQIQTEERIHIGDNVFINGWKEMSKAFSDYLKNTPPAKAALLKNYQVWTSKDKAWVTLDAYNRDTGKQDSKEMYIIRKVNGQWKVQLFSGFPK